MKATPVSKSELEKELTTIEVDAIAEEKQNAAAHYTALDSEIKNLETSMPFPGVGLYSVGFGYEDISDIQFKKQRNAPYLESIRETRKYAQCGSLYCGHVAFVRDGVQYYITDRSELKSRRIGNSQLVNTDDRAFIPIVKAWRFPNQVKDAALSRNIHMANRQVKSVDVVLDISNEASANITDGYLRKALLRNKSAASVQSIIQTIQKKQDDIRALPLKNSFIVQGCAGSGKTMVLLHRLRYLLFNEDLNGDDYIYLVPSYRFKSFIADICREFKINDRLIYPFEAYYKSILGVQNSSAQTDTDELVFDQDYLARVYSVAFLRDCYRTFLNRILGITEKLINCCEECLNSAVDNKRNVLESKEQQIITESLTIAKSITSPVSAYVGIEITTIDDVDPFLRELRNLYGTAKERLAAMNISIDDITINKDDPRILEDQELKKLAEEIENEQHILTKASIFTVLSHRRKLAKLQEAYDTMFAVVEKAAIEDERQRRIKEIQEKEPVLGNNDLSTVEQIILNLENLRNL